MAATAVSGTHSISKVSRAEPVASAPPQTERDRLQEAIARAEQEASDAKRELEQVRRERDVLQLALAAALAQLAEHDVLDVDHAELLVDEAVEESTSERLALPPPFVMPSVSVIAAPAPSPSTSVSVAPEASVALEADEALVSLSRLVVSTRPPAEMETEADRPSDVTDPNERPSSVERRRRARIGCEFEVEFLGESHLIAGLTQDISAGGVFVATYRILPLGTVVSLGLELPSGRVVVRGTVRWRRDEVEDGDERPGLGIQFMDLDAQTVAVLTEVCRTHPARYYEM